MILSKRLIISAIVILGIVVLTIVFWKRSETDKISKRDFAQIEEDGTLHVVTDYNAINYFVSADSITGFTKDLLNAFASYSGLKLKISLENSLQKNIESLQSGKVDIVARNIPVNNTLKGKVLFTNPIMRNKLVLVQRLPLEGEQRQLIRNHLNLAKKTIYVPYASPAMLRLQNLAIEIGDTIYIKEDSLYESSQLIMKVAAGEIDYAVVDAQIAYNQLKTNPEVDIKTDIGFTHLEAWAVRNTSPVLLDSLNNWLDAFMQTPQFKRIYKKYYR